MNYGYIRVSSIQQNIDRQLFDIKKLDILDKNIYIDKESGKDFSRTNYLKLKKKIKKGDCLFVKSIDRLGRNYKEIINEWNYLVNTIEIDIVILDMPLLDTRKDKNLLGKFISDLVLQILSFVAENERQMIKQRQAEGIKIAKAKGIKFGAPCKQLPSNFDELCKSYLNNELTLTKILEITNISKATFYRKLKYINEQKDHSSR